MKPNDPWFDYTMLLYPKARTYLDIIEQFTFFIILNLAGDFQKLRSLGTFGTAVVF